MKSLLGPLQALSHFSIVKIRLVSQQTSESKWCQMRLGPVPIQRSQASAVCTAPAGPLRTLPLVLAFQPPTERVSHPDGAGGKTASVG